MGDGGCVGPAKAGDCADGEEIREVQGGGEGRFARRMWRAIPRIDGLALLGEGVGDGHVEGAVVVVDVPRA